VKSGQPRFAGAVMPAELQLLDSPTPRSSLPTAYRPPYHIPPMQHIDPAARGS